MLLSVIPVEAIIVLVIMVVGVIVFLLLPALLELRKPKDAGPRKIEKLLKKQNNE